MKLILHLVVLAFASLTVLESRAQFIFINLSYKVVLNPANGSRPNSITDASIDQAVARMNQLQGPYFRGFRFRRVDPVTEIGGVGNPTGPSQWYNTDFFDQINGTTWQNQMEFAARHNSDYHWNNAAINIYVTAGICGGVCSFPGHDIINIGGCSFSQDGAIQMHEIGHHFNLCHTQGCPCAGCDSTKTGQCYTTPGDDEIADTLPDLQCWSRDQIAIFSFAGRTYSQLTASERERVDDVFLNIMSYHNPASRLTENQIDHWTDAANGVRLPVTSGRTWYVNAGGSVQGGLNSANPAGGDIVLIRPGAYNEHLTISQPVTLRATRAGPVTIGSPVPAAFTAARPALPMVAPATSNEPFKAAGDGLPGRLDFPGTARK
jgi:hypothetical protein